jgi:CMP-N,N'-diacetyllegionaminic acid synthase
MPNSSEPNNLEDVIFLIPARSGSKGIPRKNLQIINGNTLVEISIKQALKVVSPNNIYVSSDSHEILEYAENLKVNCVLRSDRESSDTSDANIVVEHFIQNKFLSDSKKDSLVYLQPTSPFRDSDLILNCINLHKKFNIPVITVRRIIDHPEKMVSIANGRVKSYLSDFNPTGNRQLMKTLFIPSGSIYVFSIDDFLKNKCRIPIIDALSVEVDREKIIDIDTEYDLLLAQTIGEKFEF